MEKIFSNNSSQIVKHPPNFYELKTWSKDLLISGIDEVGRGCLAGPVVTCAVILHPHFSHQLLKDSKILTENQRCVAAEIIRKNAWYSFGVVDHFSIDRHNIYQATLLAMKRAYYGLISLPHLPQLPQLVLVDAMPVKISQKGLEIISFTKGESRSISIAAASILAKVMRDALISRLAQNFPDHGWPKNKGYAAHTHCTSLRSKGATLVHRKSFLSKFQEGTNDEDRKQQASLFC